MARPSEYIPDIAKSAQLYLDNYDKEDTGVIPSIAGLALWLDIARSTAYEWMQDEDKPEFSDICEKVLAEQEKILIGKGLKGEFNPTITKLMMSKHGYKDSIDHTTDNQPIKSVNVT